MKKNFLLYIAALCLAFSGCKQTDKDAQDQFRERQQAILEHADQTGEPATQTTDEISPVPTETKAEKNQKPAASTGDKVVAVKDGDTIVLLQNGETITIRLYGVDAPEKVQDFGQKAKQFTSDLAFGKNVKLIAHNKDRYGRTVGTIILPDGRSLNEELLRNGYAWHYKAYSKDQNLANLEVDARRFKRGLWQDPNPTAPWDFRKNKKSSSATKPSTANAPVPAGAAKRTVYICDSSGSSVYHLNKNCSVLKRCKANIITTTEAAAIREYGRRADKTCSR
jgi:endonuclease YncB( thermonuclease family)